MGKDVEGEEHSAKHRNNKETSKDVFNITQRRLANQNNDKGECKEEDKIKMKKK